jgi:hypothetical protein
VAMRFYKRSVQVDPTNGFSTPEINTDNSQTLNEDLLISVNIGQYEKEAKWVICFLQTDVSLSERERCEIACEKFKKQQATVK